ncbi:MAG: ribosome recycling factor [Planctomycetota bacterium]|nr:ribosome recycling factor [Planctomycetota bacterium]
MDIDEALLEAEDKMIKTCADYDAFLKGVRTGQASIEVFDRVHVDIPAYGGIVPLKSVAVVSRQDATMIIIKPFDPKTLKEVEKAISIADLGVTTSNDGKILRCAFPAMSEERRKATVKQIKERLEQHKISLRNERKDALKHIEDNKGKPGISEDMVEKAKEDVQGLIKQYEGQLDTSFDKKSKEIMTV